MSTITLAGRAAAVKQLLTGIPSPCARIALRDKSVPISINSFHPWPLHHMIPHLSPLHLASQSAQSWTTVLHDAFTFLMSFSGWHLTPSCTRAAAATVLTSLHLRQASWFLFFVSLQFYISICILVWCQFSYETPGIFLNQCTMYSKVPRLHILLFLVHFTAITSPSQLEENYSLILTLRILRFGGMTWWMSKVSNLKSEQPEWFSKVGVHHLEPKVAHGAKECFSA